MAATFLSDLVRYRRFFLMTLVLGLGGTLLVGFQVSVITYPSQDIKRFINATWMERHRAPLPPETVALLWSLVVSIYCLGGFLGSLSSQPLTARYGKKKTLLLSDLFAVTAALLLGSSKMAGSFEMVLLGRALYGVGAGMYVNTYAPYLGEISPKKFRGFAFTTGAVFFSLGKALGQIMGLRDLLGHPSLWPVLLALCGVPALLNLLLLPLFPESPPYLLIEKEDKEGCLKAMKDLWGDGCHKAEMEAIMREKEATGNSKSLTVLEVLKDTSLRRPLAITILLIMSLQTNGLSAIYFYAFEVFRTAKLEEALIPYVTLGMGVCEFASVILCSSIIDRVGRRILLWGGYGAMAWALAFLVLTLSLQDQYPWISYCSVTLIFLFTFLYGIGPAGAVFSVAMEVFSQSARSSGFVIASLVSWVGLFLMGIGFPFVMVQYQKLLQMIVVLGIGGTFSIGYQISVINYPSEFIRRFMNETWIERTGSPLHEKTLLFLWSFIVSVYGAGGLLGSLCCGYLTVKYGKKKSLLGVDVLVAATALLVGYSRRAKSFELLMVGRFLYGVAAGFCLTIHPQYAGEISPKRLRGLANATTGFFWSLGKSLGQVLGLRECLGTESSWPCLLAFTGATALLQLAALPFFPESPPHLWIEKGDEGACLRAMNQLWGSGGHQEELGDLKKEAGAEGKGRPPQSPRQLLRDGSQRRQLHVLLALVATLQLCGINAVYFYASDVFSQAGFGEQLLPYLALGLGLCELSASVLCVLTIERFGRRTLLWKGCGLMALVLLLFTVTLALQTKYPAMSYCSVTLLFLFVFIFGVGPNGATMAVMMEIFSQWSRPAAFMIGGCLNWAGLFVLGITFPFAVESLGPFCFLIFTAVLVATGMFFCLFLPETKGKSIVEITEDFEGSHSSPNGWKLPAFLGRGFQEDQSIYASF
ncbi:hypothetical protein JRQ81_007726 [Phrynocephalus forsythii]|uniref:Solute carrier family 2, facilitated glucose transporter member 5 n=1 Tax=Phrynocephalus forsythii TaxID=171643 RepID=A0A9Q1ATB4_9SAUR|nr:hypothetical protein JRQ81_007726 [Phrynocephalus forsythii]